MRFRLSLIAIAVGAAVAPMPAAAVERYYSNGLFPFLQNGVTGFSNLQPAALLDISIVVALAWFVWHGERAIASGRQIGWRRSALRWLAGVVAATAVLYLTFLVMWGLNYRRLPLVEKVRFDPQGVSPAAAHGLALTSVDEVNTLYDRPRSNSLMTVRIDRQLADSFAGAQRTLGVTRLARPGVPKWSILDVYFRSAGVQGMTDPYFLETLVAGDLLAFEQPFVIAHEWAHLAGFADEGEANFVGWLTCTRASDTAKYSGWLFLYTEVTAALSATDRADVVKRLGVGPRDDLRASAERVRRHLRPAVANAGWRVYDRYLKANRIDEGTASYAEVVRLVLGVRLVPE